MNNSSTETAVARKPGPGNTAMYKPEFELLLCSARTVPDAARIEALISGGIDWRAFLDLATKEGLRPIVYKSLRTVCWDRVPEAIQTEWQQAYQSLTGRILFITGEMLRITAEFQTAEVPVAVLKGPVLAEMAYGDFALREFSDLDLLIREADFSRAIELLRRSGYEPFWKCDNRKAVRFLRHMGEYKLASSFGQTEIDLHWKVAHKTVALSPGVGDFPSGLQPVRIAGSSVLSFAPQDLPLYLAAQGGCDQWCDLRRICDLAELIRRYPDIEWEPHLETAHRLGGLRTMLTGLSLASGLLDAQLPESVVNRIRADANVSLLVERTAQNLQRQLDSPGPVSRYVYQMKAKEGLRKKIALACSILTDRTAEDGSWIMLPRPLWWLYSLLRPLRMSGKILRRA
ncbi:MAG: nucleotidyltransferase family protein [Silvibacterium sp.]